MAPARALYDVNMKPLLSLDEADWLGEIHVAAVEAFCIKGETWWHLPGERTRGTQDCQDD